MPLVTREFFAVEGLVPYDLNGLFASSWANDIDEKKSAVYEANLSCIFEACRWKVLPVWKRSLKNKIETIIVEKIQSILDRFLEVHNDDN